MQSAALATLFHVASSKAKIIIIIMYPHCPEGGNSWCKYNADRPNGTNTYEPGPGLPFAVLMKVRPIFEKLTTDEFMEKLMHGKTQNQNESFNATIWERLPKTKFASLRTLQFGVYDVVANF